MRPTRTVQGDVFCSPQKADRMIWAGLLTSRVRPDAASRFAFPGVAEWHVKRRPSLTVAGPRRIRTGFPVRPVVGAQTRHGITMCYNLRCPGGPIASSSLQVFASLLAACVAVVAIESATASARGTVGEVVENCTVSTTYERPPARAVTLNQAATEVMLALHLEDRLVGTAYLDDRILPGLSAAYERVPVLASKYPSMEVLLAARPDFLYAAYPGAFGPASDRGQTGNAGASTRISRQRDARKRVVRLESLSRRRSTRSVMSRGSSVSRRAPNG